jgi:hypothetical protein
MSKAIGTRGSFASQSGHARLKRYQLLGCGGCWKARVPYGTWRIFETWEEARDWLTERHGQRVANSRRQERVSRSS